MPRIKHYTQLVFFDTLAVICMIAAILTGWLPGPGGIPLFIIGLSLLAINHEWAQRYIDLLREYADKISDFIFTPRLRVFFDIVAPILFAIGITIIVNHTSMFILGAGIFFTFMGLLCFLGNRNRWARFKKAFKKPSTKK